MSARFCMVTTFYPPYHFGGDAIGIQRLVRGLARRGHHVTVIHDVDAWRVLSGRPEPRPVIEPDGVVVHRLHSGMGALATLLTQQTGRPIVKGARIREIIDAGRFDVINFHNMSLVGGPGLFSAGSAVKLYMAHEHWLVCPTHVLWRHMREVCTGQECFRCTLAYHRPPQYWRYTGYLERQLHHIDTFIAMSEFSRRKHKEFGFPRDMEVLPYFLPDPDTDAPPAPEGPSPWPRPYFLFVGRLERIKGLDDVIPAFSHYEGADLLIAGDGEHGPALRRQAAGIERVHFLGRVSLDDLRRYYRHAVALVVPSVCYETFGIIIIEAFREATPVIARRIGPLPEIVERSAGGRLFDTADELPEIFATLQRDADLRRTLGCAGWEAYRDRWCERAVVPRYLELVERSGSGRLQRRRSPALAPHVSA